MSKIFVVAATLIAATSWGASSMTSTVKINEFQVVGISVRTNNALEMSPNGVIPKMWGRFFKEGILAKIPNKAEPTIFAVYTDYESDRNGEYTFLIGAKIKSTENLPEGLVAKTIPAGQYVLYNSDKGPTSKVVPGVWKKIWAQETTNEIKRVYRADFESYDQRASDPQNSQVDVYVGTK